MGLENKRVLVTGGAGFIGSNLCEHFVKNNQVICLDNLSTGFKHNIEDLTDNPNFEFVDGDIRDLDLCLRITKDIDIVFHQAALGSVSRSIENPINTNSNNIDGFLNVIWACVQNKVERFVFAASSSTYGDHQAIPKIEENIGKPLSPYAITKYVNELYAENFSKLYGLKTIGLRYFNVFGKKQTPDGPYAAVIPKFVKQLMDGEAPVINGDGSHSRDFTYIDNVIEANVLAGTTNNSEAFSQVYNIAFGQKTSLNELVDYLKTEIAAQLESFDTSITPVYGPERLGDVKHSLASIEKAKKLIGYEPKVDVENGIRQSIKWYINNLK